MADIVPVTQPAAIVCLEEACRALAEATSVPEVKKLRDQAKVFAEYVQRQRLGLAAALDALEVKLRAERRAGELLRDNPDFGPGKKSTTLVDLGIDHQMTAWRWQRLADLPEEIFLQKLAEGRQKTLEENDRKIARLTLSYMLSVLDELEGKTRQTPPLPPGTFQVLYADPPWQYGDQRAGQENDVWRGGAGSGRAASHYPALPTDAICSLTDRAGRCVKDVAPSTSALFLWATAPCLPDALRVIEAWGFEYKAQFVWDKVRGFNGHYNDVRHELLLIALRGSFPPRCERLRPSVVTAPKTRHSRKPDVFYEIIEEMYPLGDRPSHLELFARSPRTGWISWGNEACLDTKSTTPT